MLQEWINIAIKTKTCEMIDLCEEHTDNLYCSLIEYLNEIKNTNPELISITDKIENIFLVKTQEDVKFVFPISIEKGIQIGKNIR
ncbi:hypothetical protein D3C72_247530 [compost metagenome]